MLEKLHVEGYALIDSIEIELSRGLNVLSGETGAGKSILVDALNLLLGEKGDATAVRESSEESVVAGVFRVEGNSEALSWLSERGIEPEDGEIILRRTLRASGKGRAFIQSVPSTRGDLAGLTNCMIDMHGQHEHQSLFRREIHREFIDSYGGLRKPADIFHGIFLKLSQKKKELESLEKDERDRLREQDMLTFALNEIEAAELRIGEEEELRRETSLLSQSEKLYALLQDFHDLVSHGGNGALGNVRKASDVLAGVTEIDKTLLPTLDRFKNAYYEIEDIGESIRHYKETIDFSPDRLEVCQDRLALIRKLEKKYGAGVDGILSYAEECRRQLSTLESWEESKSSLVNEITDLEKEVANQARSLSDKRKASAEKLGTEIQQNLKNLGMPNAEFIIEIGRKLSESGRPVCGPWGMDHPEFLISANPGEKPKPLRKIASGGEMSRIMLAIKAVLAETDTIQGLVFDEIDSGIGGEVAVSVGKYLKTLSTHKQVLCVTHLASIAVHADNHIKVSKTSSETYTVTDVRHIDGDERIAEIARMLAGDSKGQTSLAHAEEMLKAAGRA